MHGSQPLTPDLVLSAYAQGWFPMAERRDDPELFWLSPEERGVIPLQSFHVPRRLARLVRSDVFAVRYNTAFDAVIRACAAPAPDRRESWINADILALYDSLHAMGHAHSVECWRGDALVGGLYGVSLGGAFFGESMFSPRARRQQGRAGASRRAADRGRLHAARCPVHHHASFAIRRAGDSPAAIISNASTAP